MMAPIPLVWRGQTHNIPANRAFKAGAAVERIVTLGEVGTWGNKVPFHTLSSAYAVLLSFAGVTATEEEVLADIMAGLQALGQGDDTAADLPALTAVQALVNCLMGGAPAAEPAPGGGEAPKT